MTEPAPRMLYDGANYIDIASAQMISPVTLSATTSSGGTFASGVARRHALDDPPTNCSASNSCNPYCPGSVDTCVYPLPIGGVGGPGGEYSGPAFDGGHGGSGGSGGGASRGGGAAAVLGPDWDPEAIAALRALGYTYSFGNGALAVGIQIAMGLIPFGEEAEAVAGETFFRTMSASDFETLSATGQIPATSDTFISPSLEYASQYNGVTVQLTVNAGTTEGLLGIGVRNAGLNISPYADLPLVQSGWTTGNAFFKLEGGVVNIGLGRGTGLDFFNSNLVNYTVVP